MQIIEGLGDRRLDTDVAKPRLLTLRCPKAAASQSSVSDLPFPTVSFTPLGRVLGACLSSCCYITNIIDWLT